MTLCMNWVGPPMAHTRKQKLNLSVEYMYSWLENDILESGRRSRGQTIDDIRKSTFYRSFDRTASLPPRSRPQSSASSVSGLPFLSRANTTLPSYYHDNHTRANTSHAAYSYDSQSVATQDSRALTCASAPPSTSASISICLRAQSALNKDTENDVGSLARQCCDVLGPFICNQCAKLKRRDDNLEESEEVFTALHTSEDNFAKSVMVKSCMPDMTPYEIETKIARGDISLDTFRDRLQKKRQRAHQKNGKNETSELAERRNRTRKKTTLAPDGAAWTFFTGIQDLNHKICSGRMSKRSGLSLSGNNEQDRNKNKIVDNLNSMFISPRKFKEAEPYYKAHYDPPLLSVANQNAHYDPPLLPVTSQNAEPAFFAGSGDEYRLPDRLPETIVFEGGEVASVEALSMPPLDRVTPDISEELCANTERYDSSEKKTSRSSSEQCAVANNSVPNELKYIATGSVNVEKTVTESSEIVISSENHDT